MGPVVAWPLLMCCTIIVSQMWGFVYKEWVFGDKGLVHNAIAMLLLMASIATTAAAGAV